MESETDWAAAIDEAIHAATGSRVPPDTGFFEAGLDSRSIVAAHDRLAARIGWAPGVASFFHHPNRRALAAYLRRQATSANPSTEPPAPAAVEAWDPAARRAFRARLRPGREDGQR